MSEKVKKTVYLSAGQNAFLERKVAALRLLAPVEKRDKITVASLIAASVELYQRQDKDES